MDCSTAGRLGGLSRSAKKQTASRANGRKRKRGGTAPAPVQPTAPARPSLLLVTAIKEQQ